MQFRHFGVSLAGGQRPFGLMDAPGTELGVDSLVRGRNPSDKLIG